MVVVSARRAGIAAARVVVALQNHARTNSKPAIVLEWGAVYVRCGIAGEPCPRMRLPSPLGALAVGGERLNETAWRGALDEFVAKLFAEELLTMPQKRIVLNVEDAALPRARVGRWPTPCTTPAPRSSPSLLL